jgi:DNA-binding NtrC family response regulator
VNLEKALAVIGRHIDMWFTQVPHGGGQGHPAPAEKSAGIARNHAVLSVLIVDDEPLIRWSLSKGLTRRGHYVVEADTGKATLERIADGRRFDVIVLDYRLADRQDLSLLGDVRRLAPSSAVFMMTAYGDAEMREQALALGARGVVDKPFQVSTFVGMIESAGEA